MLPLWTKVILALPIIFMVVQDFRSRRISVIVLAVFAAEAVCYEWLSAGVVDMFMRMAINAGLLAFMFGGVALWLWVRRTKERKSLKTHIGLGDVLFMAALTPLFGLREFVWFLLVSMVAGLVWWAVMGAVKRDGTLTVPLVGVMGSVCIFWIVLSMFL